MSEQIQNNSHEKSYAPLTPEHAEHHIDKPEHATHHEAQEKHHDLEKIHDAIEMQKPVESTELLSKLNLAEAEKPVLSANRELKKIALNNYLSDIRSNLGSGAKQFSKFIHNQKVNSISEVTGKTIVRPTAILFGGIFMFIGSTVYLYATYKTNARYNFIVALFLFIGGFIAGLIVELIYKIFLSRDF